MIEEIRGNVDRIGVITVGVCETMRDGANVVVADDSTLLTDAAWRCRGTARHVDAGVDAVLQEEPMCAGGTRLARDGIDARGGARIGSGNLSAVVDASRDGRRRARILNRGRDERFRGRGRRRSNACQKDRRGKDERRSRNMDSGLL